MRRAGIVLATIALVLGVTGPARAGETHTLSTKDFIGPGYAQAQIQMEFLSKHTVDVLGWVRDVCPADGAGAYVTVYAVVSSDSKLEITSKSDTNGCGDAKVHFDPAPFKTTATIYGVWVLLCERDADKPSGREECTWKGYPNWRVP